MEVKINRLLWKIEEIESVDSRLYVNEKYCFGVCEYAIRTIYLDKNMEERYKRKVLRHELCHALLASYMLRSKDEYTEEELCEFVALYADEIKEIEFRYFNAGK